MSEHAADHTLRRVLMAFYPGEDEAKQATAQLADAEKDFPLDRVSLLGKVSSSGDDPLGVYSPAISERMKGWGRIGAFWGGLCELLGGPGRLWAELRRDAATAGSASAP